MTSARLACLLVFLPLLAGCAGLPGPRTDTPVPSPTAAAALSPAPSLPAPTSAAPPTTPATMTLRIWLPPEFDPAQDTPAGRLLQARLDEFQKRRANLSVEVRLKEPESSGGMIDTLTTANAAARLALPDLVALPGAALETAVLKGLVYPFEASAVQNENEWYPYARQIGTLQERQFGLPFAGDVLVLAYRPALIGQPPANWQEVVSSPAPLLFTAGSPLSLFTLAQYQASGGAVLDSQGRPRLDSATLQGVLEFFTQAQAGEQMPFWLTQYETEEQVWQAYMENRSTLAVTWASHFLKEIPADTALAPLPTQSGEPFSLAGGWVWALTSPDSEQRAASAQLARFLAASDFAAEWSQAAGYLPTQPAALFTWHDSTLQAIASRVMVSAQRIPSGDILISLAPALSQATIEVLKQQSDARSAAEKAAGRVNGP